MNKNSKIYIAGHAGLIGSALLCELKRQGYKNLIFREKKELDLKDEKKVRVFFEKENPEYVFLAAGVSGGILANTIYPANLIYENIRLESNVIHNAYESGVKKLIYIGCACLYPRNCRQPIKENYLLDGPFEPSSEMFSVAKLAGIKMCQAYNEQHKTNFIRCVTENLFGPKDTFDPKWGHVIPTLIKRFHDAKVKGESKVVVWGSGKPLRSFMYIEDAASALTFLMKNYNSGELINIGSNLEISIAGLAELVKKVVGFKGKILFDVSKPDGAPKKMLDVKKFLALGFKPKFNLKEGIRKTYDWYLHSFGASCK